MIFVLAITHRNGIRLAEIGFLLLLFSGLWFAAAELPRFKIANTRRIVAGLALAAGGLLLLIATHWGHFA
jgi:hypothetical protein